MRSKTYNIRHSPVVTHPSTTLTITSLSMGERTGSRIFQYLWSYVMDFWWPGLLCSLGEDRACELAKRRARSRAALTFSGPSSSDAAYDGVKSLVAVRVIAQRQRK
ncbi:hypothetical protein CONLIGDRAFT_69995 [Coniochaeta ligniaria NRRL 30616]|uniref:Uncharacterized protein n=1 Tax=Coniochaeta ligniaria NRRL 30616 TaxID=1408157 RepID=A0A1J7IUN5_9PEZI|nr:hypothetical protein CONLIGDRAFT_69995 [Coniochaeta ligniaria NRRL 30616]